VLTFALQVGIKLFKGENAQLLLVFLTSLYILIIPLVFLIIFGLLYPNWIGYVIALIVSVIIAPFIIKAKHKTTFLGAIGAVFVYIIMVVIIYVIIYVFLTLVYVAFLEVFNIFF